MLFCIIFTQKYHANFYLILKYLCLFICIIFFWTGACCIDDFTARALDIDFLIHYGHSCLIPIDQTTGIKLLYIFVDIKIDVVHCIQCLESTLSVNNKIALVSTIQFAGSLQAIAAEMRRDDYKITIPQSKPLSPGEVIRKQNFLH